MADGTQRQVAYITEVTYGTTPGSPQMQVVRTTGGGLKVSRSALESQEFTTDRSIKVVRPGTKAASFEIPAEMSYGSHEDFFESMMFGAWATDTLKQGNTKKSFTIEEGFTDIPAYQTLTGCIVNTFNLSLRQNSVVTMNFGFIGKSASTLGATPLDATPTAATTSSVFDSYTGAITEGGSAIATVTDLSLDVNNNLEQVFALFLVDPSYLVSGKARISGRMSCYFADLALANKFLNGTASALVITLTSPSGQDYIFTIPKILYTGNDRTVSETKVMIDLPFTAYYDATLTSQMSITRSAT